MDEKLKFKKILHNLLRFFYWIQNILNVQKWPFIFLSLAALLFWLEKNNFFTLFNYGYNSIVLLMLFPIFCIVIALHGFVCKPGALSQDGYIAISAIIIALFTYFTQNTFIAVDRLKDEESAKRSIMYSLLGGNKSNCATARSIIEASNKQEHTIFIASYITNIYKDNIAFFYKNGDPQKGDKMLEAINAMDTTNRLIDAVQSLNLTYTNKVINPAITDKAIDTFDQQIINESKIIKQDLQEISKDYAQVCQ